MKKTNQAEAGASLSGCVNFDRFTAVRREAACPVLVSHPDVALNKCARGCASDSCLGKAPDAEEEPQGSPIGSKTTSMRLSNELSKARGKQRETRQNQGLLQALSWDRQ
jgi:hypothetical protein